MAKRVTFLRAAREAAGYRQASEFANAYGLPESTYRSHDNGIRSLTVPAAKVYSRLLLKKVPWATWQFLIDGVRQPAETAEMLGYVGAGEQIFPFDSKHAEDPILAPPGMIDPVAARVQGDSMRPVYRDGDLLFADRAKKGTADILQRDCLVEVEGGLTQVKQVRRAPKRGFYRLYSYRTDSTSDDVRLISAVPVEWVMRR